MSDTNPPAIICIHGLWMRGMEMALLRSNLRRETGFAVTQFSYFPVTEGLAENMRRLSSVIDRTAAESVHLVCHSLGGVLALQMLKRYSAGKVGRVVCLGSPLVDSAAARNLSRRDWGNKILGKTLREGVLEVPLRSSDTGHEVGVIGGTLGVGLGMLIGSLDRPHDGVVSQKETELPGLTDRLMLPVSHFGLLLSRRASHQTARFLCHGSFDHGGSFGRGA